MQRVLSAKNPREASMMSGWVNVVLTFPRYFLITGLTILAIVFFSDQIRGMGTKMDFELILPYALGKFVPAGLLGFLIAGLLAAYMSNFAATVNAAPRTYVRLSYLSSFLVVVIGVLIGWFVASVNSVVIWIVSGLWGGYTASNILKWYWWRFNGYGYFWGMVTGIAGSLTIPGIMSRIPSLQHWANLRSLNLDVSIGFATVFIVGMVGCLLGTY
jgi:Na+/proline symporter